MVLLAIPTARAADFDDADYHQEVIIEWDSPHLDVLILPPAMAYSPFRQQVLLDNVEDWAAAIADHGVSWLASNVELVAYAPGLHAAPPAGFELDDPDILVVLSVEPGVVGAAATTDLCTFMPYGHQHAGSAWSVQLGTDCSDETEPICVINNTNWMTTQEGLFLLNGHEFGHCLGLGHVGDARDFSAANVPYDDVMSYSEEKTGCPSTLDLLAMQGAFAAVLGEDPPAYDYVDGRPFVSEDPDDHAVHDCDGATPVPSGLPDPDWFPL